MTAPSAVLQGAMFPLAELRDTDRSVVNPLLIAWEHKMGPIRRPPEYGEWCHVLLHEGRPIALAVASTLVRTHVAGFAGRLTRESTVELSRICAARPGLCRAMLRLWRELVFPSLPFRFAISYSARKYHTGELYRFDGWRYLGRSRSGTDRRTNRDGFDRHIWGWGVPADWTMEDGA
ncbi:MAG TPA: hypothetical protein VFN76_09825 [Candidatus Limnocylindria bacterium]|nr:hypothetical protein [Candidatus Limnocylindria bacterium]